MIGLRGQFLGGDGHFFGGRGVLLDGAIQRIDDLVDLGGAAVLLATGGGNLADHFGRGADGGGKFFKHPHRRGGNGLAGGGEVIDLCGSYLAPLCQLANFRRHHGKALAVLPAH